MSLLYFTVQWCWILLGWVFQYFTEFVVTFYTCLVLALRFSLICCKMVYFVLGVIITEYNPGWGTFFLIIFTSFHSFFRICQLKICLYWCLIFRNIFKVGFGKRALFSYLYVFEGKNMIFFHNGYIRYLGVAIIFAFCCYGEFFQYSRSIFMTFFITWRTWDFIEVSTVDWSKPLYIILSPNALFHLIYTLWIWWISPSIIIRTSIKYILY